MAGFLKFLKFVLDSPHKRLLKIIQSNHKVIGVVGEVVLNILLKNIPVKPEVVRKLRKYKRVLYALVDPNVNSKKKIKILTRNIKLLKVIAPLLPLIINSLQNEPLYENVSHHRKRKAYAGYGKKRSNRT